MALNLSVFWMLQDQQAPVSARELTVPDQHALLALSSQPTAVCAELSEPALGRVLAQQQKLGIIFLQTD